MTATNLGMIAEKVLGQEEQFAVSLLLRQGKIREARDHVLAGIDSSYWDWHLSFMEAAEFYNLLDLTPQRAALFPQRHNRAFF